MKVAVIAAGLAASIIGSASAETPPDAKAALQQYYREYLAQLPWGPPSSGTTFKSFYLGQRLAVGERTPFALCKAMKDINGENACWGIPPGDRFACPFTPPVIRCTGFQMSSTQERDPALTSVLTAFGNKVRPSLQIALDDWFSDPAHQPLAGRLIGIIIKADEPSADFVPTAIDHFTRATGQRPRITVDDKDKDIISRQCRSNVDKLYAGRAKTVEEMAAALSKCETDSLEKFFISTTRSVYYVWAASDPGFPRNKEVAMGVQRDLIGTRVTIEMSYKGGEAERQFKAKVDALSAALKAAKEKRNKDDF